jgi:hypothetical protein
MKVKELFAFVRERHAIYERRLAGEPKPWTKDPILQKFRFCNIYRELDAVTVWIRKYWREPNANDPDLWFAMVVARMYNLPTTLTMIEYPVLYEPRRIRRVVNAMQSEGLTVFNAAYMVRCDCQQAGKTKTDYLIEKVFNPMWRDRETLRPRSTDTLAQFHTRLMSCYGMGSFMAGQVTADTKFHGVLATAEDWWTFACPGPGSQRGLNWVCGREFNQSWKEDDWYRALQLLQTKIDPLVREAGMPRLSASDLQSCLCEISKYQKVKLGLGRPKQLYPGV